MVSKVTSMREAVERYVSDGCSLAVEGFTAFICFAAAHEIIRQGRRDLTLIRMTPDLVYDQMVAAGTARKLIFSYLGNPGIGSLHAIRRAVEQGLPGPLELEEYTHFGMIGRYIAGASRLPFFPLRSFSGSDLPRVNPNIRMLTDPFLGEQIAVVPPLNPDVAILHAQRADEQGNTQAWGLLGVQKEVAFASRHVIVVVEEIVEPALIRRDPNRTLIPDMIVDAVVHEPFGAHPSYVQGYYDRDNQQDQAWDGLSREPQALQDWLERWVYGVQDRQAYLKLLPPGTLERLKPLPVRSEAVDYGGYR
ncbi:MAG: CoA-transferase [Anaerolineales bacterium]